MTDQEQLDQLTEKLGEIIRGVDMIAKAARKEASERCMAGQNDLSADLRSIEASLRMGAGMLTEAYAKGRRLAMPTAGGGIITPFSGGS